MSSALFKQKIHIFSKYHFCWEEQQCRQRGESLKHPINAFSNSPNQYTRATMLSKVCAPFISPYPAYYSYHYLLVATFYNIYLIRFGMCVLETYAYTATISLITVE